MKAIAVVFFRAPEEQASQEIRKTSDTGVLTARTTLRRQEQSPPFWTWFIENPRLLEPNEAAL